MKLLRLTLLGIALALPAAGFAQWQWIDKDGRKVFSDQAPPPDIPAKSILRQPTSAKSSALAPTAAPADAASAAQAPKSPASAPPRLSGKDKELEEKKKKSDAAEAQKRKDKEDETAKARAENCERAKRSKATFDSGVRIARFNSKGEREILDDAARATEAQRLANIIAENCKPAAD